MIHGRCLCGGVRFEVIGPAATMSSCYCSRCHKAYASPVGTVVVVNRSDFSYHRLRPVSAEDGEIIFDMREKAKQFYVIEQGQAELWQPGLYDDELKRPRCWGRGLFWRGSPANGRTA